MQEVKGTTNLEPQTFALAGTLILPLGGLHEVFAVVGGLALMYGMAGLLERVSLGELKKTFGLGLLLAIVGGLWAKHVLDAYGFDIKRLLITAFVSGVGLYIQSRCYSALARVKGKEILELGGILLVIGSATFWFYVSFIPLSLGVLLIAYSFWRW